VGDNLADALRADADYLTEATRWALDLGERRPSQATKAISAGSRLDDAVRGYLNEQGAKRMAKADLWLLVMAAQRIRLTAHSLSSLPVRHESARHPQPGNRPAGVALEPEYAGLASFYEQIAGQVQDPHAGPATLTEIPLPASVLSLAAEPEKGNGLASYDPETLWVQMHLEQLGSHAAGLSGPAAKLARLRRAAWWRPEGRQP